MPLRLIVFLAFAGTSFSFATRLPAQATASEISGLQAFDKHCAIGLRVDDCLHPIFRLHAGNAVFDKEGTLVREKRLPEPISARNVEFVRVVQDVGVVMGSETRTGATAKDLRFTHIHLREGRRWLLIARHEAEIVPRTTEFAVEPPGADSRPSAAPAAVPANADEAALLAANADSTKAVVASDAATMAVRLHPAYLVTTPEFKVYDRDGIVELFAKRRIDSDRFERTVESLTVARDLGFVMGRELVVPKPGTRSAPVLTHRRYSAFYVREATGWRQLARQAHVVRKSAM